MAVIMEWIFLRDDGSYTKMCPKDKVEELTKLFLSNGYTPFLVRDDRRDKIRHKKIWCRMEMELENQCCLLSNSIASFH